MICGIQMNQLAKRLQERSLELVVSDDALDFIGDAGFDPVYGARPLKRAIQQEVENPLAQLILGGKFAPGEKVYVNLVDGALTFDSQEVVPAQAAVH